MAPASPMTWIRWTTPIPARRPSCGGSGARSDPGAIVSLHLGHPETIAAMPGILRALDQHGLAAVTASDLLSRT